MAPGDFCAERLKPAQDEGREILRRPQKRERCPRAAAPWRPLEEPLRIRASRGEESPPEALRAGGLAGWRAGGGVRGGGKWLRLPSLSRGGAAESAGHLCARHSGLCVARRCVQETSRKYPKIELSATLRAADDASAVGMWAEVESYGGACYRPRGQEKPNRGGGI
ncbi:uncharacterized protein LOC117084987 [Trachypithecus francoisi]|uniref:uncharacterized protein LOC117084987 n=1 Tax=Trachypithecus francoisi TaxID=54180 RepID=UPI00141AF05C|nr:uncharacterized protein LOC117084987 [Trachypithecus francoisi]